MPGTPGGWGLFPTMSQILPTTTSLGRGGRDPSHAARGHAERAADVPIGAPGAPQRQHLDATRIAGAMRTTSGREEQSQSPTGRSVR